MINTHFLKLNLPNPERDSIIDFGHRICQRIRDLKEGEDLYVHEEDWLPFWDYQYNPEKGETPRGEMERWLNSFQYTIKIIWVHDFLNRRFCFHRVKK